MTNSDKLLKDAKRALSSGENFLAYDIAATIPDTPDGPPPQKTWVMALALARSGSYRRARELAETLPDVDDIDIMGLKSRIYKDLAASDQDPERRRAFFLEAARRSKDIFNKKRAWYNGINAASCLRMAGEELESRRLIEDHVLPLCQAEPVKDMWLEATLGECRLLLSDFDDAARHYSRAAEIAANCDALGDFSSSLRQLKMLLSSFPPGTPDLWSLITLPSVCVFTGHRIDMSDRQPPRFPASAEQHVRKRIDEVVKKNKITNGYASCADGGDILFLESVLAAGGHVCVVPPFPIERAVRLSISSPSWEERLKAVLANPRTQTIEPECDVVGENDEIAYDFTNRYMLGLAKLKAHSLNLPFRGLAVWDRITPTSTGNTTSAILLWQNSKLEYDIIEPGITI